MVHYGTSWRRVKAPEATPPTREQAQRSVNNDYVEGRIPIEDWRAKTTELSDLSKWDSSGPIPPPKQQTKPNNRS